MEWMVRLSHAFFCQPNAMRLYCLPPPPDQGHIALDVLVHEGDDRGARQVGRCVFPVGSWDGQLRARADGHERNVVAEGCFPVLSIKDSKHVGDLRVRLRACLGPSSRLRRMLEAAQSSVGETRTTVDSSQVMKARGEIRLDDEPDGAVVAEQAQEVTAGETWQQPAVDRPQGLLADGGGAQGLPVRRSFDSDDLSNISSVGAPTKRLPPDAAPLSSFQLNEALAKFDVSGALPVWPTPKGSLYRPPETHGEAPPTPRHSDAGRGGSRGRLAFSAQLSAARKKSKMSRSAVDRDPRDVLSSSNAGVGTREQAPARGPVETAERELRGAEERFETIPAKSISPERQAPGANRSPLSSRPDATSPTEKPLSPEDRTAFPYIQAAAVPAAVDVRDVDSACLAQLLDRGNELRKKMVHLVETINRTAANVPTTTCKQDVHTVANPPPDLQLDQFADTSRPGLMSTARLGSSLRDDIEGIFDTLSDNDTVTEDVGVPIRDPEARENEDRMVDLLLAAAGPPPSSLAFPVLAEVERRRAESLSQVRFLRIRITRLVMFGSMTSAPEGHGWQLRFRLPAFTMSPGRGKYAEGPSGASTKTGKKGSAVPATRVISLPIPARAPKSTLDRSSRARGRVVGKSKAGNTGSTAGSMLRVRRGYGAADMVVGETPLVEEVVCAVNVNDACVRRWMDAAVEFLLVDGRSDGVRSPAPNRPRKMNLQQNQSGAMEFSSTVGPGDRVAAVATLPLRDLVLSAELALASTLDLTEVVDFWAAEDARAAAAGRRRQGGRPLRNPYRGDSATAARPLVLGDRAVGALAVGMELLPGEAPVSPEHSELPEREAVHLSQVRRGRVGGTGGKNEDQKGLGGDNASPGLGNRGVEPHPSDESVFEAAASVDEEKVQGSPLQFPTVRASLRVEGGAAEGGAEEVALAGERKKEVGREAKDEAPWSVMPHDERTSPPEGLGGCVGGENEGGGVERQGPVDVMENGTAEEGFATILRLDGLRLASATASTPVAHVRVAYSYTQVRLGNST